MLFLKSILDQDEQSMVFKFLKLQFQQPIKNDWVSTCKRDLEEMNIDLKFEDIRMMQKGTFLKIIKSKIEVLALNYLLKKRGSKGKEIVYKRLEMANYLLPHNEKISIEEKQRLFSFRNRMIDVGNNFGKNEQCVICKQKEDMNHIYNYQYQNKQSNEIPFEKIYTGNLIEQMKVFKKFEENLKIRNEYKEQDRKKSPCDPFCDPLLYRKG